MNKELLMTDEEVIRQIISLIQLSDYFNDVEVIEACKILNSKIFKYMFYRPIDEFTAFLSLLDKTYLENQSILKKLYPEVYNEV